MKHSLSRSGASAALALLVLSQLSYGMTVFSIPYAIAANTSTICFTMENLGYATYDRHLACRVIAPGGTRVIVSYPAKWNGKLGLTPGPTQDVRPFNWGIMTVSSPGWNCQEIPNKGLVCTPNGQAAGAIDIGFEAVGDCGTHAGVAAKAVDANTAYSAATDSWHNDGTWSGVDVVFPSCQAPAPLGQCSDGIDNDADGKVDMQDPGCSSPQDNDETNAAPTTLPACSDGLDNDNDGKTDFFDAGCYPNNVFNPALYNPNDTDESNAAALCRWTRVNSQWVRSCI
jgi:hypothetical protein